MYVRFSLTTSSATLISLSTYVRACVAATAVVISAGSVRGLYVLFLLEGTMRNRLRRTQKPAPDCCRLFVQYYFDEVNITERGTVWRILRSENGAKPLSNKRKGIYKTNYRPLYSFFFVEQYGAVIEEHRFPVKTQNHLLSAE